MHREARTSVAAGLALASVFAVCAVGCSRRWHRQQADCDAGCRIQEKGGFLDNGNVSARPDSRMRDPYSLDCPPMPADDPASHRYMHCVDGKRGWKHWHRNGTASNIEPGAWLGALPRGEDGTVELSLRDAVAVARVNSRDYQTNLETLYRSALDVTFERFRFDHQFFAGNRTFQDFRGRDVGASSLRSDKVRFSSTRARPPNLSSG